MWGWLSRFGVLGCNRAESRKLGGARLLGSSADGTRLRCVCHAPNLGAVQRQWRVGILALQGMQPHLTRVTWSVCVLRVGGTWHADGARVGRTRNR
jgi:hypothetical protein